MKYLLDTHVLLWAAYEPEKLSGSCVEKLSDRENILLFSSVSIWEISIKTTLGRDDFVVDVRDLLRGLRLNDYNEMVVKSEHAIAQMLLPMLHKDPFDRKLIAQATVEKVCFLTADSEVLRYEGPIEKV